jgi:RDD family protein
VPYTSPDGRETAEYAPLGRRVQAGALDWGICLVLYLLVSIPGGLLQIGSSVAGPASDALDVLAKALVVLAPAAYLAGYLRTGHTLGMRALDLHARVASTGRRPGWARAAGRSLLSVVFGAAVYLTFFGLSGPGQGQTWSHRERAVLVAAYLVAIGMVAGMLWALGDRRRQSIWDKAFGLVRLEDLTSATTDTARYNLWLQQRSGA